MKKKGTIAVLLLWTLILGMIFFPEVVLVILLGFLILVFSVMIYHGAESW